MLIVKTLFLLIFFCIPGVVFTMDCSTAPKVLTAHEVKTGPVELSEGWKYYDGLFIPPDEISSYDGEVINAATTLSAQGFEQFGYGTLSFTAYLDGIHQPAILIPDIYSAYRLFVNGDLIFELGTVGKSKQEEIPQRSRQLIPLTNVRDSVHLVIHLSNFHHSKFGFSKVPAIGLYDKMKQTDVIEISFNLFLTGCLTMGGFFFTGLYIFGRKTKMGLYFALFCFAYGYWVFSRGHFILHELIPAYPWSLSIRMEYISMYLSGLFFIRYITRLYRPDSVSWLVLSFNVLSLLFIIFAAFTPVYWFTSVNPLYPVLLITMLFYALFIYAKAVLQRRDSAFYALLSMLVISAVFITKTFSYFKLADEPLLLTGIGQIVFFFFQAVILSKVFANEWIRAKNEAERLSKAKSEFLSIMSHEIRTPLNAILGTTYHLLEDHPNERHIADLNNLRRSGENLCTLVDNIFDYSNMTFSHIAVDHQRADLAMFLKEEVSPYRSMAIEKGLDFQLTIDPSIPKYLLVDRIKLGQIIKNLLDNAIKFTAAGEICCSVRLDKRTEEKVQLLFSVKDSGIGIRQEMQKKIFQVFEQGNQSESREYTGIGLGLSISQHFLSLMSSELKVTSKKDMGSDFHFSLCAGIASPPDPQQNDSYEHLLLKDKRVLLVEDNEMNALVARRLLKKWGLKVTHCEDGNQCLAQCSQQQFDMILMDLQMPGMDGYEASHILRKNSCKTPIVALTASTKHKVGDKLSEAGINDLVSKPFRPDALYDMLSRYLMQGKTVRHKM